MCRKIPTPFSPLKCCHFKTSNLIEQEFKELSLYLVSKLFKAMPCIYIHHCFSSSKYFSKSFVFVHSFFQNSSCSVRLDGRHLWASVSKSGHRFSFAFRSGFWLDHYNTWKCFDFNYSSVCYCLYVWGHCTAERLTSASGFFPQDCHISLNQDEVTFVQHFKLIPKGVFGLGYQSKGGVDINECHAFQKIKFDVCSQLWATLCCSISP